MQELSYSEKLQDPRWKEIRAKVLERDDWRCQSCKHKKISMHVHHKKYHKKYIDGQLSFVEPWEYDLIHLETLCAECHENVSKTSKSYQQQGSCKMRNKIISGNDEIRLSALYKQKDANGFDIYVGDCYALGQRWNIIIRNNPKYKQNYKEGEFLVFISPQAKQLEKYQINLEL